ncbi:hypothetical protein GCM10023063_19090 [Arthrobacter methylotrophus]|uniref:Uncharacterized protein n=1 Tax=Arthrobacter methylotrophus TaxID=121291 RepID=A0ABV5UQE0_9MICC
MTNESAPARPYGVFIDALLVTSTFYGQTPAQMRYIDAGLTSDEAHQLARPELRSRLVAATSFRAEVVVPVLVGLVVFGVFGFIPRHSGTDLPYPFVGAILVLLGLALASAAITGSVYASRVGKQLDTVRESFIASGKIVSDFNLPDGFKTDLKRIDTALSALQRNGRADHDAQAQEAVAALLESNAHKPSARHLEIAESDAMDESSVKIRDLTNEERKRWRADIAKAETLILDIEAAASAPANASVAA